MNKRQRKKKILNGLSTEERYRRTHCPVCEYKIGVFDKYFNLTASNSPTSKVAGCKGFGLVQGLAPCA